MQRYSATSYGGGVSNNSIGGTSSRDSAKTDSSLPSNFSLNPRRPSQLTPYKLKCDKESLSGRLGPPDFYPQTSNCPEETLTKEYLQSGYKEIIEGIEEAREITFTQVGTLTKPIIVKCKEAIRKRLRAINESRAQKRKAGQVYGVRLSGSLVVKPGVFPDQRPCGEDFRKKWIESLSQQHKRLRSLGDHVPHGYRKKSLFEVLIRNNVPLLRATWFIKVTYLNQVRPVSTSVSSGAPDKTQLARTELWTKDVIEFLQYLFDEISSKDGSLSTLHGRDQSPQTLLAGSVKHRGDSVHAIPDGEEPSLQFKWWYMVRILQWHHAEGLLLPSLIIDWVLNQLQEKESVEALQLVLPIIVIVIESIALSQTYVRMLVGIAIRSIQDFSPGGSDIEDKFRRSYIASALVEMLRYLLVAVPDTFVALDCFPLPTGVVPDAMNGRNSLWKVSEDVEKTHYDHQDQVNVYNKRQDSYPSFLSIGYMVSSIHKRAANLAKAVGPGLQGYGVAKVVQALDKALILGDMRGAYNCLFEDLCDGGIEEGWMAEVDPCLRASLHCIGSVSLSFVCSVFFLCEWATCDFRDCRIAPSHNLKFTGKKDFSQVYVAVRLLRLRMEHMRSSLLRENGRSSTLAKGSTQHGIFSGGTISENVSPFGNDKSLDILRSPGPLHDILVCWLDQHDASKGEGFKRLQVLIMELIRFGIFYPQAYVRQLIVSGIMDRNGTSVNLARQKRHYRILKQLPGSYLFDTMEEARVAGIPVPFEDMRVYSNERRLVLDGLLCGHPNHLDKGNDHLSFALKKQKNNSSGKDGGLASSMDNLKNFHAAHSPLSSMLVKTKAQVEELKASISILLHIPNSCSAYIITQPAESQAGLKRSIGSLVTKINMAEGTPGCEECRRAKRQKPSEEKDSHLQGLSSNPSDDDDTWWVRKGPKSLESFKVDPPLKSTKLASRGRQKTVRKTQSLAQLGAARIEGSQGASTSHVCDNKVSCPHHRNVMDSEIPKSVDGLRMTPLNDIVTIGKALKRLRLLEKRSIATWLIASIKQNIEGSVKAAAKVDQCTGHFSPPVDERSPVQWKLDEDGLSSILYLLDVSSDLFSAVKFLLWLYPKVLTSPYSTAHNGRNILILSKNTESACEVGEAFLLSCMRRYENVLLATDLLPEVLTASMHRGVTAIASNGRASSSVAFIYAQNLLRKYGHVVSVAKWEKSFKATCDQRLLTELESGRSLDSELGASVGGVPAGVENFDDYFRQKISGRLSRAGPSMKEIVQRHIEEAVHYFYGKERKFFAATTPKACTTEKWDDGYQIAQQIVLGLMECIRQNSNASQEVDPSVVASAVSAIVGNVGPAVVKVSDFTVNNNYAKFSSISLNCARRIINIHITCLSLLKEALGERQGRVFEIALAIEASSCVSVALAPGKAPRSQFQLSPETPDSNSNISNEILNNSTKVYLGRAAKAVATVSALVLGAVVRGVASLERMVTVFRLKEGLDVLQFIRSARSNSNGISRSTGAIKVDNSIEVYLHWFRLLIGNCRTVSDGLVVDLLGESYNLALSRMQRMLPINLVFPPAYSIFAIVIWRQYILNNSREEIQLYQSLLSTISDAIKHQPFRDVCLRDTRAFYDLLSFDVSDSEFAAMLELQSPDKNLKMTAFVPLRARLFLSSILDCKMPRFVLLQEDGTWAPGHGEKVYSENEMKLQDQLVHVLDTLQPAKFHWQWVELRLLLNEQVLIEKIETPDTSLVKTIRSFPPNCDNSALSESENNFAEIVLTRLLVRPDAAPLYSEIVHLLGKPLEESLLLHTKWFLAGNDVLLGRKSIRQRLINIAQLRGLSTKLQFWKPWGWSSSTADPATKTGDKRKLEVASLEEGEVVDEGLDVKRSGKLSFEMSDVEGVNSSQQCVTEKALAELVLPCIDRSSSDSRNTFASDLIKQMINIEQHISAVTCGASKQPGVGQPGVEGAPNKSNSRRSIKGGSPGLSRRLTGAADSTPPSAAALRSSMWLRLQFLLRLLPIIYTDREPSGRNMRHMLASVLLRLLGTRLVHEDANLFLFPLQRNSPFKREVESPMAVSVATSLDLYGDSLFDRFLCVLHGLLSNCRPSWLKPKSASKSTVKSPWDFPVFDREVAASLQNDLDRMQLPAVIRWRIQTAMPMLPPSPPISVSCQPPMVSFTALGSLQSSISTPVFQQGNSNAPQRNPIASSRGASISGKSKPLPSHDPDMEIDPWTLLEDGTGCGPSSGNSSAGVVGDHTNLKACSWLRGAVRVRRTDLNYIGPVDDDS